MSSSNESPKLCVDCRYIATNGSRESQYYKCFSPKNPSKINLVTGERVFQIPFCSLQRDNTNMPDRCNDTGDWFEPMPPRPVIQPTPTPAPKVSGKINMGKLSVDDI